MERIKDFTTKHRKPLYIIAAAMIIIISCYFGFQGKDDWSSEKYGTTIDGQIGITKGSELKTTFTINRENFQGVSVKLSTYSKNFVDEKIIFTLLDTKTKDVIVENEMILRNEAVNSGLFVELPVEQSKNREVTLIITGENINTIPYLCTSNNSNYKSKFSINGVTKENVLVLSAVYLTKQKINSSCFIKGLVVLLMLLLAYFWPMTDTNKAKDIQKGKKETRIADIIRYFFAKHKRIIVFMVISLIYMGFAFFIYKWYVRELLIDKECVEVLKKPKNICELVIDSNTKELCQIFTADQNYLSSITLRVKGTNLKKNSAIRVLVEEKTGKYVYNDSIIKVGGISEDYSDTIINFQKEFTKSKNKKIKLIIEPIDFKDESLFIRCGDVSTKSECFINGARQGLTPLITANYRDNGFFIRIYALYILAIYIVLFTIWYVFVIRQISVEKAFLRLAFLFGLLYLFIIPVYVVPDENSHVDTAYKISNHILGIEDSNRISYLYKRKDDIETEYANEHAADMHMYRKIYYSILDDKVDVSLEESYGTDAISNAGVIFYLPAAIGITFARLLCMNTYMMLLLGRLFNLISYVLLTYASIKILPDKKGVLAVIATLPISLQQAASFSYDCILNAFAFLFIAYCYRYIATNEKVSRTDAVIMLILTMTLASVKGGVYLPLLLILFIIPIQNGVDKKKVIYFLGVVFFIIISYLQNNIISMINRMNVQQVANVNGFNGESMYTLSDLINDPVMTLMLFINTFVDKTDYYIDTMLGGRLGSLNYMLSWWNVIIIIVVLLILGYVDRSKKIKYGVFARVLVGFAFLGCLGLVLLSMLVASTSIENNAIAGVQGRYFIPILMLPFISLSKNISFEENKKIKLINNTLLFNSINYVYMLLYIVIIIVNKNI